ncbi:MAG: DNA mismatch repair endonuclease MutH [Gammaproteobacteria bacterium]
MTAAPRSEAELLQRAQDLAGKTLSQLAQELNLQLPATATRGKGWIGQAVEQFLGATAGSQAEPDFQYLGIELKTIPVDAGPRAKESTFVTMVPHTTALETIWQDSSVYHKLRRVLWVPVEAGTDIAFAGRRIGSGFLWSPDAAQEKILRSDWEELMELVGFGEFDKLSASIGQYLQIRPKAANAASAVRIMDHTAETTQTLPRGFYLRPTLTNELLQTNRQTDNATND